MKTATAIAAAMAAVLATPAVAERYELNDGQMDEVAAGLLFRVDKQVSNQPGVAPVTDPLLVNPWGISQAPGGPIWTSNQGSGTSTLYNATTFAKVALTVAIPGPDGAAGAGLPTGTVFNPAIAGQTPFPVTNGQTTGRGVFLFATLQGTISGWNPTVNATNAVNAVFRPGDAYTGLTIATNAGAPRLFAADFGSGVVRMFDQSFGLLGSFTDPDLPAGYAPFNVQALNNKLYVTFALKDPATGRNVPGIGRGFVSVFNADGSFDQRLVSRSLLNSPWGVTIAPDSFGSRFAGALLVGNFGDGWVNAYDPVTGRFIGPLIDAQGGLVKIDGLWALHRGNNGQVIFSSGPNNGTNGLVGTLTRKTLLDFIPSAARAFVEPFLPAGL